MTFARDVMKTIGTVFPDDIAANECLRERDHCLTNQPAADLLQGIQCKRNADQVDETAHSRGKKEPAREDSRGV
jgi:hypothetical protein